jgi:hypothetical protein
MSEQAVEERRGWASDIVWVVVYSILVPLGGGAGLAVAPCAGQLLSAK